MLRAAAVTHLPWQPGARRLEWSPTALSFKRLFIADFQVSEKNSYKGIVSRKSGTQLVRRETKRANYTIDLAGRRRHCGDRQRMLAEYRDR
jgi:hypothetical protein